jgi:acylpyruvate hydrolase
MIRQAGNTKDMLFNIPSLISFISSKMTLEPYDFILTGMCPRRVEKKKISLFVVFLIP